MFTQYVDGDAIWKWW